MIRVFLVDDHAVVRAGVRALLSAEPDICVVGEAGDGRKAITALEEPTLGVDVLVLDLSMPRMHGLELLERARAVRPKLAILVLSFYPEAQYARWTVSAGAAGYVAKSRSEDEIVDAVRAVAAGRAWVSRAVAAASLDARAPHERFTPRETQVFVLLVNGSSVTDIAAELDLSVSTVSTHLGKIRSKLGVETVAEVVGYAHRVGLVG
jgi:DNA-binding NarL/FixJ family response regulator